MIAIPHEWQQIDQGLGDCLNCHQNSTIAGPLCSGLQTSLAESDNHDTLWREADRLARQMEGLSKRLFAFRDQLKQSTAG